MKKPTIKDVASRACVSTALVSRVMNAPLKTDGMPDCVVHPDTAERIFKAIKELGYHPNKAAVSLRKTLKKRIGVIIPNISNPFFADIARHIESLARKQGYIVLFGSTDDQAQQLGTLAEAFMEDGVDGMIITPGIGCHEQIAKVVSQGIPVVLTIRDIPGLEGAAKVLDDDEAATNLAIDHLISQGYHKIDMVSPQQRISNAELREDLFTAKMRGLGLDCKIYHEESSEGSTDINLILEHAVRRGTRALYCASASIPIRILEAARQMGLKIPEDIAIIGYDGGNNYELLSPSISQIEFSREEIAKNAFDALMFEIKHPEEQVRTIKIRPKLIPGESTVITSKPRPENPDIPETLISSLVQASRIIDETINLFSRLNK